MSIGRGERFEGPNCLGDFAPMGKIWGDVFILRNVRVSLRTSSNLADTHYHYRRDIRRQPVYHLRSLVSQTQLVWAIKMSHVRRH